MEAKDVMRSENIHVKDYVRAVHHAVFI
jgi:hypothetical protein